MSAISERIAAGQCVLIEPTLLLDKDSGGWFAVIFYYAAWKTKAGHARADRSCDFLRGRTRADVDDQIAAIVELAGGESSCLLSEARSAELLEAFREGRLSSELAGAV